MGIFYSKTTLIRCWTLASQHIIGIIMPYILLTMGPIMNLFTRIKKILPFILLFTLLSLLGTELFSATDKKTPATLVGDPIPKFRLTSVYQNKSNELTKFTAANIPDGLVLLTYWATWCDACRAEHSMLMDIKNKFGIPMYGIVYKDNESDVKQFLASNGNPFIMIGDDASGDTAMDFGIYGTPETYLIYNHRIVYHYLGGITDDVWADKFYPLIKKYQKA